MLSACIIVAVSSMSGPQIIENGSTRIKTDKRTMVLRCPEGTIDRFIAQRPSGLRYFAKPNTGQQGALNAPIR